MSRIRSALFGTVALGAAVFVSAALLGPGAAAADDRDQPFPPFKIGEGLYYVGSNDYTAYLFATKAASIMPKLAAGLAPLA